MREEEQMTINKAVETDNYTKCSQMQKVSLKKEDIVFLWPFSYSPQVLVTIISKEISDRNVIFVLN